MKSMTTLIRVKQREIDAIKRQQDLMLKQREDLHTILEGLSNQLANEIKTAEAMPEMAHFFGDFAATIKKRQEMMHGHLRKVETELDKLANLLRDKFSEMKKYELAHSNWMRRQKEAARKTEERAMDELAIRGYNQRHVY